MFRTIKDNILVKVTPRVLELQASYPNESNKFKHLFQVNEDGVSYVSEYLGLPILEVSSFELHYAGNNPVSGRYVGSDQESGWAEIMHDLGKSSTGANKYMVALEGTVACVMYVN